jgi:hypothetical protein
MTRAVACLALTALICLPNAATAATRLPAGRAIRGALRASAVPVLLPSALPRELGSVRSVAVISAGRDGYYVGYSPLDHCAGALACAFFHIAGFAPPARLEHLGHDRALRLSDGTRALYRPSDCSGASCTEASLFFARRGTLYELDAKTGADDLRVLTQVYRTLRIERCRDNS